MSTINSLSRRTRQLVQRCNVSRNLSTRSLAPTVSSSFSRMPTTNNKNARQEFVPAQFQRRSLVMVTQTKSSELPSPETEDVSTATKPFDESDYKVLSDVLQVTPACLSRVEALIQKRHEKDGSNSFLRVYVDAGGCSGFQYQFEFDQEFDEDEDIVVVASAGSDAPRVVVDEISLGFLEGSTLDFVQEMIRSSFVVVDNPKSEAACGCGSSFAVKNFAANPALD